jgi:hypothetical protein
VNFEPFTTSFVPRGEPTLLFRKGLEKNPGDKFNPEARISPLGVELKTGAYPMIASYNASLVKIYSATNSLARV